MPYPFELRPLPFSYTALSPEISETTLHCPMPTRLSLPTSAATRSTFTMTSTCKPMWTI